MAQENILIDDIKPTLLSTYANSNIADFICHEACREYYRVYNKKWVPSTYFAFVFDEYKKYAFLANNDIRAFFKMYKERDIYALIENYMNNNLSVLTKRRERENYTLYLISDFDLLGVSFANDNVYGGFNEPLYKSLANIEQHINASDELLTKKELYEKYLLKHFVIKDLKLNQTSKTEAKAISKAEAEIAATEPKEEDRVMVGSTTDVPTQKGKIVKMYFPRLSLPSSYPTSQEKSTVNSDHVAKKFMRIDKQLTLMNKYKFNGVKYHKSFIDKRKAAQKPAKKKFNFEF